MSLSELTKFVSEHGVVSGFLALWGITLPQFIVEPLRFYTWYFVRFLAAVADSARTYYRFLYLYVPPAAVIGKTS